MRYLCLPGAFGSAKTFQTQLAPIARALSADGSTFFYTQGTHECTPPDGFLEYFGPGPHYRFIDHDGMQKHEDVLLRLREFPEGEVAEDVLRELMQPSDKEQVRDSVNSALDELYHTMEIHGPFDGICAYSEGATVAATLILDEERRFREEGRPRQLKAAIFFAGWPPLLPGTNDMVLADSSDAMIDIPSCHVVGAMDPYIHGAVALYNVCDEDTAILFDHGKGHTLPRDAKTVKELADVIHGMTSDWSDGGSPTVGSP